MRILSSSETVMLALLSICAFALLSAPVQAQTSQPSNDSQDLQKLAPNSNYHLHTGLTSLDPIQLAPLTRPLIDLVGQVDLYVSFQHPPSKPPPPNMSLPGNRVIGVSAPPPATTTLPH